MVILNGRAWARAVGINGQRSFVYSYQSLTEGFLVGQGNLPLISCGEDFGDLCDYN